MTMTVKGKRMANMVVDWIKILLGHVRMAHAALMVQSPIVLETQQYCQTLQYDCPLFQYYM